jgi:signal transduction histidine kinase
LIRVLPFRVWKPNLSSAVSNLITNAVRYTPKDGTITVRWYLNDSGEACYSVQDTGIGIAAQDIPRLTERFLPRGQGPFALHGWHRPGSGHHQTHHRAT